MRSKQIQKLIDEVEKSYGTITLYGSHEDERHGTCFKLKDIPATFSISTEEGKMPKDTFSIQIENSPPGEYVCYLDACKLDDFLK